MTTQHADGLAPDPDRATRSHDSSPTPDGLGTRSLSRSAQDIGPICPPPIGVRRPLPRRDTSESMQPEFCDDDVSISLSVPVPGPPFKLVSS